jgi:inorganic triphosphatase YgiF
LPQRLVELGAGQEALRAQLEQALKQLEEREAMVSAAIGEARRDLLGLQETVRQTLGGLNTVLEADLARGRREMATLVEAELARARRELAGAIEGTSLRNEIVQTRQEIATRVEALAKLHEELHRASPEARWRVLPARRPWQFEDRGLMGRVGPWLLLLVLVLMGIGFWFLFTRY